MKRKLQVFISSTYEDLHDERQAAVEEILKCGHIPAGMELFGSDNKSQFDIIKKWIEDCDVFILILGGKYGSFSKDKRIKKSYIQREYEYALSIGKAPYALIMSEDAIKDKMKEGIYSFEKPEYTSKKYKDFKKLILDNKLCDFFSTVSELKEQINNIMRKCEERIRKLSGWINIDELKQNPDILKSILESQISEFDKCYNPYFYHNYNREVENYHFFKEYFDITTNRLFESIDHFTIIDKYERIITVTIGEDGNVKITATTTVKFLSVKDSNYFSFDPRFNRVDEANSLKNIKFLIYNNDSHAVDVVKDIRSKIIDHGDGARWRYQVNNILPLPLPAECKNLKIIHEYSFFTDIDHVFQMNQLRYPCRDYSIQIFLSGFDMNYIPVVSSCSQYNVYSAKRFETEQFKGQNHYSIRLPDWSSPGCGYFFTLQKA